MVSDDLIMAGGNVSKNKKPLPAVTAQMFREEVMKRYRQYLLFECGEIQLDGMPADDKVGSKTLELEKLFVPTKLERVNSNKSLHNFVLMDFKNKLYEARKAGADSYIQWIEDHLEQIETGQGNQNDEEYVLFTIERYLHVDDSYIARSIDECSQEKIRNIQSRVQMLKAEWREKNFVVPSRQLGFRRVILAGPGGGKTTFLKRLAMAYAFPERRVDPGIDDKLPDRELLPIWIRCRELREKATLSLTEIINCIPSWAGFRRDCPELIDAFHTEVSERLEKGELLLLIDGLDEIANTGVRKIFAKEIVQFAELYPTANIIVTSRISGFEYVSDGKLGAFPRLQISELSNGDIRLLCRKWHKIIYGDREESITQADALTHTILSYNRIRALAGSPLLLMTLLLVQRRVGRLPTRRVTLYEESIQVLLETWNQEAFDPIDLDEAVCQLSYVAFEMMRQGVQIIGRQDLVALLKAVRKEQSWLSSELEPIETFLERVELRSSLLTKRGYRPTDSGELEAEYEFQHLTFQEYLAALAVVNGYYAGADQKSSYLDVLENFYDDANKEEVVLLAAAQVNRKEVTQIVESIISRIKCFDAKKKNAATKIRLLRNLLMKIVLDEVQLVEKTRTSIFKTVTDGIIWKGQTSLFRDLLKSTFGEEFRGSLKEGWTPLLSALDFQADEKDDPIGKYFSKIKSGDNDFENWKQMLRTFDYIIWTMDEYDVRIRLERDGYIERMVYLFVSIIMNSTDEQAISYSALCMRSILDVGCKISPTCIPCGFTQKLLSSINREVKNNFTFQLFGVLPVDNENAQKLFWFDCPDEIKQFLSDSLSAVSYGNKEGVFWAAVFAGVWSWDKAETILKKVFVEENDVTRNEMLKKLNQLRVSAESCPSKVEDV